MMRCGVIDACIDFWGVGVRVGGLAGGERVGREMDGRTDGYEGIYLSICAINPPTY